MECLRKDIKEQIGEEFEFPTPPAKTLTLKDILLRNTVPINLAKEVELAIKRYLDKLSIPNRINKA